MGQKGSHLISGAKGAAPVLPHSVLAPLSDKELMAEVEEAALSEAQERAVGIAPKMIDVLEEVAEQSRSDPARVAAAREVLNQAHGRPESRDPKRAGLGRGLVIQLVNFTLDGQAQPQREFEVEQAEPYDAGPAGSVEVEVDDF